MAHQLCNAMASRSEPSPVTSSEVASAPLSTTPAPASAGMPALLDNVNAFHAQQSMALIPTSSSTPTSTSLTASNASGGMSTAGQTSQTSTPHNVLQDGEEAWPLVTRSLMVAVMEIQPRASAASILLEVFRPMVDGLANARKEGKIWKKRAEMYTAEHHKHKIELAHKHDTLQAQAEGLQQSIAESQSRVQELESQQSTNVAKVSALETTLGEAEAQARTAKEAHAQAAQQSKKEVEAMTKSAQEAKVMYERLRQETDNRTRSQNAEITKLQDKIKELEAIKGKLEERHGSSMAKTTSLEEELAQKGQDISNLQTRITEITTRKEALERQLALYQRIPTRRF